MMNINQKVEQVRGMIQQQLTNVGFTSLGNTSIPLHFQVDNDKSEGANNVMQVTSIEEAKEIISQISNNQEFSNTIKDYSKPLYMSVEVLFPS